MENFRIDFTRSDPFLDGNRLGENGEKNAVQLIITPPDSLASREEIRSYVVAFSTGRGPVRYGPFPKSETLTVPVGKALTVGSALSVQLEGYDSDGEFIIKSPVISGILISSSIADGNNDINDKDIIPGHFHENLDILDYLSEKDGVLTYKNKDIATGQQIVNIKTVELSYSDGSFLLLAGHPSLFNVTVCALKDPDNNLYVPDGVKIISVELKIDTEEESVWTDIHNMNTYGKYCGYFVNQHTAFYDEDFGGTVVSLVSYQNDEKNLFLDAITEFRISGLRVRYADESGESE